MAIFTIVPIILRLIIASFFFLIFRMLWLRGWKFLFFYHSLLPVWSKVSGLCFSIQVKRWKYLDFFVLQSKMKKIRGHCGKFPNFRLFSLMILWAFPLLAFPFSTTIYRLKAKWSQNTTRNMKKKIHYRPTV